MQVYVAPSKSEAWSFTLFSSASNSFLVPHVLVASINTFPAASLRSQVIHFLHPEENSKANSANSKRG